ncbi:Ig-like domain-containing protein [Bdellovibrio bacteriovorus]|uniref:Ig-like domain-containing protein n=1 Tax=Bdellovibrio bacteriovorus TaxID=959 RepID=UPI0021D1B30D|nr:Ig-like domain-containing protein [Bdellovibrio bacteriovorus]UXR63246.1 Ig-like domain-containing protein [Bdellovibrio bacteriovorus]
MHTCRWGHAKLWSVLGDIIPLFAFVLMLSACSERDLKMSFLNSTTKGNQGDFVIDTGSGGGSELVSEGTGPVDLDVTCDKAIDKIEVENPQTSQWRDVTELASGTEFDCATSGQAKLKLPLDYIAPYQAPAKPGDVVQDFQIRWYVKNLLGEVQVFYRTLTLKFKAPQLLIEEATDINVAAVAGGSYVISGSCAEAEGVIAVTGPFNGSPLSANCDTHKQFSVPTHYNGGTNKTEATIRVTHSKAGAYRSYSEVEKTVKVDVTEPAVTMESVTPDPANSAIAIKVTFSEPVRNFNATDVVLSSGQVSGFAGSGTVYTFSVTPANQGPFTATLEEGAVQDISGNPNSTAASVARNFDSVQPSVILSSSASANTSSAIPVAVTFSEPVTGFTASDVVISSGTVTGFTGSEKSYSFSVTPTAQGVFSVSIAAGVAADTAGNPNLAAPAFTRTFDSVKPTLTLASATSASTNAATIPVTATFSESVINFAASDVVVTNGTLSGFTGSGKDYSFTVTPAGQGAVSVSVAADVATDATGNGNAAATLNRTFDTASPTVTITSTAPSATNIAAIPVTVTFSEAVTGFTAADVTVSGGTLGTISGSGATYNFTVTATAAGPVTVSIPAAVAFDAAGNTNLAATALNRIYDNIKPGVTITSSAPATTNVQIPVTVTFSESVTDFTIEEVVITNGTASSLLGSGTTYTFTVTPLAQGTVTVAVGAGVAKDAAGNANTAATTLSRVFDSAAPTLTLTSAAAANTNAAFSVTATFSKSVTGFAASDITMTNGTVSGFAGSGTTYTFTVTPTAQGSVNVTVPAGVATDTTGNGNATATLSRVYDSVKPTVSLASSAPTATNTAIPVTVTFSEPVLNFAVADITATGGTISGFTGSGANYSFTFSPNIQGTVTVAIAKDVAQDAAGNTNTAATALSRVFDSVPPNLAGVTLIQTTYLTRTAAINFSTEAGAVVEVRIENNSSGSVVLNWQQVSSGFYYNTTVSSGVVYKYSLRATDAAGNISIETVKTLPAFSCPNEFVYIHNPNIAAVEPFCVGQFEAKMSGGVPRFIATYAPSSLSLMEATAACTGMGDGYDLISNQEWNTIADLIARQGANWTSGTMGTGLLQRGDNQSSASTAVNVADPCAPNMPSLCDSNALRRSHYLPHGQLIWDFAGNAVEVVKDADGVVYSDAKYLYAATQTAYTLDTKYGTILTCSSVGSPDYCGFGKIDFTNEAGGITTIWRGGAAYEGNTVGVFSAKRTANALGTVTNGGFRCVYHP